MASSEVTCGTVARSETLNPVICTPSAIFSWPLGTRPTTRFTAPDVVAGIVDIWHSHDALAAQLTNPALRRLVCEHESELRGTALIEYVSGAPVAKLHQLYVSPSAQKQGIGRALMLAVLEHTSGAERLELEVEPANTRAVRFYRNWGFVEAGHVANCGRPGSGIPAIVMAKLLRSRNGV